MTTVQSGSADITQAMKTGEDQEEGMFTSKALEWIQNASNRKSMNVIMCVLIRFRLTKENIKTCLTCSFQKERCQYNSATFSHNASFHLLSCRGQFVIFLHERLHTTHQN